ncbi:MAG: RIP metalloprotease RseP [Tatlockia sp.]
MISTLLYFILALFVLITVHEFGHFIVARALGVKVLRFSLGFGKVLARWHDKRGTEYAFSLFPLGGYVKMLDESEGEVLAHERHLAFNNKPLLARVAVIVAGPLFNFLFAFLALWLVLLIGIKSLIPVIDEVKPGSIAAIAGLMPQQEIIALDGQPVGSWRDFQFAIMPLVGSERTVSLTVSSDSGAKQTVYLPLSQWQLDAKKPDLLASLGITPFLPKIPPQIGEVLAGSPAEKAGLKANDWVRSMNGVPLSDWRRLVDYVRLHPDTEVSLTISQEGKEKTIRVQTGSQWVDGKNQGFVGLRSQAFEWQGQGLRVQRQGVFEALHTALVQTLDLTGATFSLIGRLVTGKLALESISGPVGIAQGAGESGRNGLTYYLSFLALVSISLGVLNLLPVPMLDGGHLLFCLIELIRRRPLSDGIKTVGVYFGLLLLAGLMVLALSNDIARLTSG